MRWQILGPAHDGWQDILGLTHKSMNQDISAELAEYWVQLVKIISECISPTATETLIQFCIGRPWGSRLVAEPGPKTQLIPTLPAFHFRMGIRAPSLDESATPADAFVLLEKLCRSTQVPMAGSALQTLKPEMRFCAINFLDPQFMYEIFPRTGTMGKLGAPSPDFQRFWIR